MADQHASPPPPVSAATVDASSGFHDIKALPDFHPIPLAEICAAFMLATALWYFLSYRRRRNRMKSLPVRVLSPLECVFEDISVLEHEREQRRVGSREFGTRLSLSLRRFVQDVFGFPAVERTAPELESRLVHALQERLPAASPDDLQGSGKKFVNIVRLCERAAYAHDAEERYPVDCEAFSEALGNAKELPSKFDEWLKQEEERLRQLAAEQAAKAAGKKPETPTAEGGTEP